MSRISRIGTPTRGHPAAENPEQSGREEPLEAGQFGVHSEFSFRFQRYLTFGVRGTRNRLRWSIRDCVVQVL